MSKLLVKLFVKDYNNSDDANVRTNYGILTSTVGIIANFLLFLVKLIIGIFINSISVIGDAFNNLSDAASSIISFIGVKIAARPADKEHPFGHGRAEYIASFIVAFLIVQVGFSVMKNSISKIISPQPVLFSGLTLIILSGSVLVKAWLGFFNRRLGKLIDSNVMKATAADSFGDVLITLTTIISIIIEKFSGLYIDGFVGFVVGLVVLISGINIAKETLLPLMGEAINKDIYKKITNKVESYDGIVGSHDLIVHDYGPNNIMATIHAEIPNDAHLVEIHEVIDTIERDILEEMDIFLVIHMDPIETKDVNILKKEGMILEILSRLEPKASIHGFRVIKSESQTSLIFDLVVPYSYTKKNRRTLIRSIIQETRKIDYHYECVITVENSFIEKG